MRATLMYGAGDVRVANVSDSVVKLPTDALVRVTASCICGSDLHPYGSMSASNGPARMGHEFIGVVEDTGSEVSTVKRGDLVVVPFRHLRRDLRLLPRGSVHLVRARRLLGQRAAGGWPG
jgi:threonine dehydrogenase-like Zn-dependent dehydrogenase